MNDYQRIIDYDFSDTVLDDKLVVKFKLKKTFSEDQFISLFSPKKGERFIIRTPDTKSSIIGIGYEATWLLDSNDFLTPPSCNAPTNDRGLAVADLSQNACVPGGARLLWEVITSYISRELTDLVTSTKKNVYVTFHNTEGTFPYNFTVEKLTGGTWNTVTPNGNIRRNYRWTYDFRNT